ncbi:LysE family transporter [uncultured Tateyamaria sp.]|uniref:LysE family translocator n=1 Tax=uncultured Tateyamaria sp. TaxID=455651 RepID=UPI00263A11FD|nr:LysE family transporter [uncultured Tateyamaria sp.]
MELLGQVDLTVVLYVAGVYAAIVVSPGPGFVLVSRLALRGEGKVCNGVIAGLATAATFYAFLAMIGLAALLNQLGWLAIAVQIAGGLYLIHLGLTSWRSSQNSRDLKRNGRLLERVSKWCPDGPFGEPVKPQGHYVLWQPLRSDCAD